jgi:hypothetical protein
MRYALMAAYRGISYEAGVGPTDADIVLFASSPPREDAGFELCAGYWRKRVSRDEIDELWESRPVGKYRSEPCLVLEELGDRLHITHLGHDAYHAERLGYWQVDRGVYEVVVPREEVTELIEERIDFHMRRAAAEPAAFLPSGPEATATGGGGIWEVAPSSNGAAAPVPTGHEPVSHGRWPGPAQGSAIADALAGRRAREAELPADPAPMPLPDAPQPAASPPPAAPQPAASPPPDAPQPMPPPAAAPQPMSPPAAFLPAAPQPDPQPASPAAPAVPPRADGATGGRRRRTRVETRWIFKDLIDMAAIPQTSYAIDEEIDGALCLIKTDDGYEVFSASDGAKHEVRFFDDEESAYFYLFGVLAAEAVRSGKLVPPTG